MFHLIGSPLLDEIGGTFAPELRAELFVVESDRYDAEAFGNSEVLLRGSSFVLKFTLERSEPYAFIAPATNPTVWTWLQLGIAAATGLKVRPEITPMTKTLKVAEAATLIRASHKALETGYGPNWAATRRVLLQLEDEFRVQCERWLNSSEAKEQLDEWERDAREALANPDEALLAALKHLGLDKRRT